MSTVADPVHAEEPASNEKSSVGTFEALKARIKSHYDVCSGYYLSLWGQHIHHGYWTESTSHLSKEDAQVALIELLLTRAGFRGENVPTQKLKVLDVGCGVGGTTRYLAKNMGWEATGVTISDEQVKIAYDLSRKDAGADTSAGPHGRLSLGSAGGSVEFIPLDAEKMGDFFGSQDKLGTFDVVWISEALSHFPNKALFFENAYKLLAPGGKLVLADWFKGENLTEKQFQDDIVPIEDGMLLPPLETEPGYVKLAEAAGFQAKKDAQGRDYMDISKNVARTW
jgi:tocopherol O-methyltransferase